MTAGREVSLVEVEIIDNTMGNSSYENPAADVKLYEKPNRKGVIIKTGNGFLTRLWLLLSNPFRYLFTGEVHY